MQASLSRGTFAAQALCAHVWEGCRSENGRAVCGGRECGGRRAVVSLSPSAPVAAGSTTSARPLSLFFRTAAGPSPAPAPPPWSHYGQPAHTRRAVAMGGRGDATSLKPGGRVCADGTTSAARFRCLSRSLSSLSPKNKTNHRRGDPARVPPLGRPLWVSWWSGGLRGADVWGERWEQADDCFFLFCAAASQRFRSDDGPIRPHLRPLTHTLPATTHHSRAGAVVVRAAKQLHFNKNGEALKRMQVSGLCFFSVARARRLRRRLSGERRERRPGGSSRMRSAAGLPPCRSGRADRWYRAP
jgi:hypothetical protein